jgi:RNA polymerase sigma-70 factor (ECF subfamily)
VKEQNRSAFDELIRRHRGRCLNLAAFILRDSGEAEEETQLACWKAFEHIHQFHGEAEFSTWLLRIVENQCLMLIRRRRRAQFVYLDDRDPEHGTESLQLASPDADPEGELGSREVIEALQAEIRRVPPMWRNVIMMRYVQEMPMDDVAAKLGITVAAAKSRLLRARLELRRRMERHCTRIGPRSLTTAPASRLERALAS